MTAKMMTKEEKKELALNTKHFAEAKALNNILKYLPKNKLIWNCWEENPDIKWQRLPANFTSIGMDLFANQCYETDNAELILCFREFGESERTMDRLLELDIPFITLLPTQKIGTKYMRKWADKKLQIIVPNSRVKFDRYVYGKLEVQTNKKDPSKKAPLAGANFDCFYYCYGLNLPNDITFMEEGKKEPKKYEQKEPKPSKAEKKIKKADETVDLFEQASKRVAEEKDAKIAELERRLAEAEQQFERRLVEVEQQLLANPVVTTVAEEVVTTVAEEVVTTLAEEVVTTVAEEVVTTEEEPEVVTKVAEEVVTKVKKLKRAEEVVTKVKKLKRFVIVDEE
jgi:hypothetical protein